ncbi:uncharacterized protein LAESUDRAFT_757480 [Laetiporus sulphureus 93-53]|uniref:FAS1 domain-containing protein n=1 Tax=Laetiporus sulphureus 93-53 TaxID=1314785 RepID=A0A165FCP3_9APHY|nr:uncharacterized protein LAESUDRAFT_757480 [Laetiporus sulphureus 93-53]KZT08768.1 hypothetical protein LAESUDRAFT_757480 [Laetiporus sulphureus 93-53]
MTFPDTQSGADTYTPQTHAQPSLADLLTIEPAASIFYSYARETELSALFADESARLTLLVPTNKAVMALARKPHQGPAPVKEGVILPEAEFDALSKRNVERWVSAHIIPESPILLTPPHTYDTMLPGTNVSFSAADPDKGNQDAPEWTRVRLNGDIRLIGMREAQNGILYMIDGTVKFE